MAEQQYEFLMNTAKADHIQQWKQGDVVSESDLKGYDVGAMVEGKRIAPVSFVTPGPKLSIDETSQYDAIVQAATQRAEKAERDLADTIYEVSQLKESLAEMSAKASQYEAVKAELDALKGGAPFLTQLKGGAEEGLGPVEAEIKEGDDAPVKPVKEPELTREQELTLLNVRQLADVMTEKGVSPQPKTKAEMIAAILEKESAA